MGQFAKLRAVKRTSGSNPTLSANFLLINPSPNAEIHCAQMEFEQTKSQLGRESSILLGNVKF